MINWLTLIGYGLCFLGAYRAGKTHPLGGGPRGREFGCRPRSSRLQSAGPSMPPSPLPQKEWREMWQPARSWSCPTSQATACCRSPTRPPRPAAPTPSRRRSSNPMSTRPRRASTPRCRPASRRLSRRRARCPRDRPGRGAWLHPPDSALRGGCRQIDWGLWRAPPHAASRVPWRC